MKLEKQDFFAAIRLARPLLIIFICVAHLPDMKGYFSDHDQWSNIASIMPIFVLDYLVRGAVPMLTVVAGYLAYQSFQKRSYVTLIKDKANRLILPFVVWNLISIFAYWSVYQLFGYAITNIADMNNFHAFASAMIGLDLNMPINVSTYFVRDLFVIMLFLPLIHFICHRIIVLVIVLFLYIAIFWNSASINYISDHFATTLLFRVDMPLFFTFGYFLGSRRFNLPQVSVKGFTVVSIFMVLLGILFSMFLSAKEPSPETFTRLRVMMGMFFVLTAPALFSLLLWSRGNVIGKTLALLSPYSFTLFLSHIVTTQVFQFIFWELMGWKPSESSPLPELTAYTLCYVVFVVTSAILILNSWRWVLKRLGRNGELQSD